MWKYKNKQIKSVEDIPECCPFAVYLFKFEDGTYYFGSKQIYFNLKVKLSKKKAKSLYSGKGSYKKFERKVKESDWLTYNSSSRIVQQKITDNQKVIKEFISFHETKKAMLLTEAQLIINSFLKKDPLCLNEWISIKTTKLKDNE